MKKYILVIFILYSATQFSIGQQIVDDGKITRREFRLKSRQMPKDERKQRLENWKYERYIQKMQAKNEKKNKNTYAKINKPSPWPAIFSKQKNKGKNKPKKQESNPAYARDNSR